MQGSLFVYRSQPGGDLPGDFQRQLYLKPTGASDELFERFSQGVALKMGRRLRCSSVTYRSRYAPSSRLLGGPF
jgi:hypothetical protein